MPPVWSHFSTSHFHKTAKTSSGVFKTDRLTPDCISGRYADHACQQGPVGGNGTSGLQLLRSPGVDGEYQEVHLESSPTHRVFGVPNQFSNNEIHPIIREVQKDTAGSSKPAQITVNFSTTPSYICREGCCNLQSCCVHYRALQRALNSTISRNNPLEYSDRFNAQITLDNEVKTVQWWSTLEKQTAESPICLLQPVLVIESDASQLGWGARCMKISTGRRWSTQEAIHHINYLELLAAFLALKTFASNQLQKGLILLRIDNISAVTYINQKRGTHSTQLSNLALEIWEWCLQHQLTIQAEHLPGSLNLVADSESRTMKDRCDWMINPKVFQQICQSLGPLQIDLFASRLTKQLPRYYSWRPAPKAEVANAFTQNWAQARGFANPPWFLISWCLNQIIQQEARVLLVTPLRVAPLIMAHQNQQQLQLTVFKMG